MVRALTLTLALLLSAISAMAQEKPVAGPAEQPPPPKAQVQPGPTTAAPKTLSNPSPALTETPPMRFEWVREGPAESCADKCREWIAAVGRITGDTLRDFEAFARTRDIRGATMVLDSSGGALAGLSLGRAIRKLGISTTVGKTQHLPPSDDGQQRVTLSPKASCASMCAFVLLGGTRRHVPSEARVLVHQIWPSAKRDDATAANYSALDLVRVQRELGNMARYTLDMGADIELFEIAMKIPPWEALRPLSNFDLARLGIYNSDDPFEPDPAGRSAISAAATSSVEAPAFPAPPSVTATEPAQAAPAPAAAVVASVQAPGSSSQQWIAVERSGSAEVVRRNPLTIEGDEIGLFELRLSCGASPDSYSISYAERRKPRDGEAATDRLNGAILVLGRERVALAIAASSRNPTGEVTSIARGRLPAAVLKDFVEGKIKSVAVATRTSGNARTLIRVGNTGLAQSLPTIAAKCAK